MHTQSCRWEKEKIIRKNRSLEEEGDKDGDTEKQRDLEGSGSDEVADSDEVRLAREELSLLQEEKEKTEKLKTKLQKELDVAKKRASQIEEVGVFLCSYHSKLL